jgi:hypothetical protein
LTGELAAAVVAATLPPPPRAFTPRQLRSLL